MKIVCIVQARMGSERLPGKVIKPILGKPMILYTLDRLSKSKYIDKLVLATSKKEEENKLESLCKEAGYEVFRGEENNVLKRYKDTVKFYIKNEEDSIIIRVTGDCPCIDPIIVDQVISYFLMNDFDYVRLDVPESFIRGFDVEIFSNSSLNKVYNKVENHVSEEYKAYKEHVTLYMYRHPEEFKIGYVKGELLYNKDYRLCVDTLEDFQLVESIYKHFQDEYVSSKSIVKFLDNNTRLLNINNNIKQKST